MQPLKAAIFGKFAQERNIRGKSASTVVYMHIPIRMALEDELQSKHNEDQVSVVIAALNEENTIASVIHIAENHPLVSEVIVISDGSTDHTIDIAKQTSARVIEFAENRGKGVAMNAGIEAAQNDVIVFLDADLIGLTPDMLTALIEPVRSGSCDMFTLVRDRVFDSYYYLPPSLVLGGERAIRREIWSLVPAEDKRGLDTELALNYYARKHGKRTGALFIPGLRQVIKEKKRGLVRGFGSRIAMFAHFVRAYFKLHIFHLDTGRGNRT